MVFELKFMEGGALVETWNNTDFIPPIDTVVTLTKFGALYKVKGLVIHRPPEAYLRLSYSVKVEATVTKEE
jgi:hypothetical protein